MDFTYLSKGFGAAALLAASALGANATHLTPDQALMRLNGAPRGMHAPAASSYTLIHSEETDGKATVYVFNRGEEGFVVVPADDRLPSLLGYSDSGALNAADIPPQLAWMLGVYSLRVLSLDACGVSTRSEEGEPSEGRGFIPPLLTSRWGQNHPYNLACPSVGDGHCVTGCVATAMAQVMKYYAYPTAGTGSHSYRWHGETLEYDFARPFRFDDMLSAYPASMDLSEESMDAVAQLMYACGVSVDMNYGVAASDASSQNIPYALASYFGYDRGARYLMKSFFTGEEWESLIYDELAAGRPVIYGGETPQGGGHQFICDGYEDPGLFHINWGWDGEGNGYFRLSELEPPVQGTGGYEGGYNIAQTAVMGMRPAVDGEATPWYPVYGGGSLELGDSNNRQLIVRFPEHMGLRNYSQATFTVEIFIKAVSESGEAYIAEKGKKVEFEPNDVYGSLGVMNLPTGLPVGNYRGYLVMKTPEGTMQDILFPLTAAPFFNLNVSESGKVTCSEGEPAEKVAIKVIGFHPEGLVEPGQETQFTYTVENVGAVEAPGVFTVEMYPVDSDDSVDGQAKSVHFPALAPGKSFSGHVDLTYDVEPGLYRLMCLGSYGEPVSGGSLLGIGVDGVEEVFGSDGLVDIYKVDGTLVRESADKDFMNALPKGLYVVRSGGRTLKVIL